MVNCSNTIRYYIYIDTLLGTNISPFEGMLEDDSSFSQGVGYGLISVKKMHSIHFRSKETSTKNPLKVNNNADGIKYQPQLVGRISSINQQYFPILTSSYSSTSGYKLTSPDLLILVGG